MTESGTAVVVTGAASGIGAGIANALMSRGTAVVAVDRDAAFAELDRAPAATVVGDVSSRRTHEAALEAAREYGGLGGWVNCAGVSLPVPLLGLDERAARSVVDINLWGTTWGTTVAINEWCETGSRGAIVNISSVHGRRAYPDYAVYEMTKAAIEALTRNVAVTYAERGIRANAVAPGGVATAGLLASLASAADPQGAAAELTDFIPAGRLASVEEIAGTVLFLLSDDAAYISGQTLVVDGAMTSHIGFVTTDTTRRPE